MAEVDRITAFCPHCGNTAQQWLLARHYHEGESYTYPAGQKTEGGPDCEYTVRVCETCSELLVYHEILHQGMSPELMYPRSVELPVSVPESVRDCYAEAGRVQKAAPNAYAVMIRRALEAICHDRGVTEGNLQRGLAELANRGDIPPTLAEITTVLRQLGNAGAHNASQKVTVPVTWAMDDFFRAVVEYVYIAPSKLKTFKDRLEGKPLKIRTAPKAAGD